MTAPAVLARVHRGDLVECTHLGHAAVANASGELVAAWGDPNAEIYPRSSCKMIQALPLVESGAAASMNLRSQHLALACASHNGAAIHTDGVRAWLAAIDRSEADLLCGRQMPGDRAARKALIARNCDPDQTHNNCSGKHTGFLTLARHLGAGPDYIDADHPVQRAVRTAFEDLTGAPSPRFAIDGCSAPNFSTTIAGLATAMARMADPGTGARAEASAALVGAMRAHPELVAGEGRACTALMRAMPDAVVKTGAEGVFTAILPARGLGVALKVIDGACRASEAAIAAILTGLGALDRDHPTARAYAHKPIRNRRDILTGHVIADAGLSRPI